jgi:hypothetical protein
MCIDYCVRNKIVEMFHAYDLRLRINRIYFSLVVVVQVDNFCDKP